MRLEAGVKGVMYFDEIREALECHRCVECRCDLDSLLSLKGGMSKDNKKEIISGCENTISGGNCVFYEVGESPLEGNVFDKIYRARSYLLSSK